MAGDSRSRLETAPQRPPSRPPAKASYRVSLRRQASWANGPPGAILIASVWPLDEAQQTIAAFLDVYGQFFQVFGLASFALNPGIALAVIQFRVIALAALQ